MSLTKDDIEAIRSVVGEEVAEVSKDLLNRMDERFDAVESDLRGLKKDVERTESKLEPTIRKVDDHEFRMKKLEREVA